MELKDKTGIRISVAVITMNEEERLPACLESQGKGSFDGRRVHKGWFPRSGKKEPDYVIEHQSFKDYSGLVAKMEMYSSLAAKEMFERGSRTGPFTPILHGLWMFFRTYILKMGILDGFDGFMISIMNAEGSFMKYAN